MLRCFWDGSKKVLGELQKPKAVGRSEWEGSQEGRTEGVSGLMGGAGEKAQLERGMREGITSASCPRRRGELGSRPQAGPCQEEGNVGLRREKGRLWGGC